MKKRISLLMVVIMLLSLATSVGASVVDEDTFKSLKPEHVSIQWMEGNDSPTTCTLTYSVPTVISEFFTKKDEAEDKEAFWAQFGLTDGWVNVQFDWALDDVNDPVSGWHYNKYWDGDPTFGLGRDSDGGYHYSDWDGVEYGPGNITETVNDSWVFRGLPNDDRWNGNPETGWVGVKDQLREDQYTYDYDEECLKIDFSKHTMYVRVRFVFTLRKDGEDDRYIFSDWSDIASCGKDAKKYEPLTAKDIPAPVITNLRMTDEEYNGNPVVAYTLTVPEDLMKKTVDVEAARGSIVSETFARVKGDSEWTGMSNSDWEIKPGEMKSALLSLMNEAHPKIDANTPIELRVRYRCSQPGFDDVFSEYSQVLVFETTEISNPTQPVPTETQPEVTKPTEETTTVAPEPEKDDKCPLCHFCPQPLGLCIFIWLLIILIIAVVVYVVIRVVKKKDKNEGNK